MLREKQLEKALITYIDNILKTSNIFILGITGLPGSGKTTLAQGLSNYLSKVYKNQQVIFIEGDLYTNYPREEKMKLVSKMASYKDYWEIFSINKLENDLKNLVKGISFNRNMLYKRETGKLQAELRVNFWSKKCIVVFEGMSVVHPKLIKIFDRILFIDADSHLCLKRKLARATYRDSKETTALFRNFEKPLFNSYKRTLLKSNAVRITE